VSIGLEHACCTHLAQHQHQLNDEAHMLYAARMIGVSFAARAQSLTLRDPGCIDDSALVRPPCTSQGRMRSYKAPFIFMFMSQDNLRSKYQVKQMVKDVVKHGHQLWVVSNQHVPCPLHVKLERTCPLTHGMGLSIR
jgi:hypothetical protein